MWGVYFCFWCCSGVDYGVELVVVVTQDSLAAGKHCRGRHRSKIQATMNTRTLHVKTGVCFASAYFGGRQYFTGASVVSAASPSPGYSRVHRAFRVAFSAPNCRVKARAAEASCREDQTDRSQKIIRRTDNRSPLQFLI